MVAAETTADDMMAVDEALAMLEKDPQAHRIVMCRFFGCWTHEETAEVLGISERTVRREWRYIRAQLYK